MMQDPFKKLKEAPYPLYIVSRPYSFDLNEDMIKLLRQEFSAELIAAKFAEAVKGKTREETEKLGKKLFDDFGEMWMRKTIQLGEAYPDRTMEVIMETIDRDGNQYLFFPHIPQRFIEIAYLSTQKFLALPMIVNNQYELAYRVPQCLLFNQIKEKCGEDVANLMTCRNSCLKALEVLRKDLNLSVVISMTASSSKDGACEFSVKKT